MKRHKYALGLYATLACARHEHCKKHRGAPPKRFEMHPLHFKDLIMDEQFRHTYFDKEKQEFMGVEIVVDAQVDRLKMVTADNTIEYL